MHELQVTQRVLHVVLDHARKNQVSQVLTVHLDIGQLHDFEHEWIQRYFDHLSKGTPAEGAKLQVEWIPVVMQCSACTHAFGVDIKQMNQIECPECRGKQCSMISGREYRVKQIEVL